MGTHLLKIIMEATGNAIERLNLMSNKLKEIDFVTQKIRLSEKFSNVGLEVNKAGRIVDSVTKQWVGMGDAVTQISSGKVDMMKYLGLEDVTPKLTGGLGFAQRMINQIGVESTKSRAKAFNLMETLKNVGIKGVEAFGGMNKKLLGIGLGMTFFMWGVQMQLQRVLRSSFNVFQQAEGETGKLNQQFNIVRANLAAISIAFWDAFAQSGMFEMIIDVVSRLADWFLDLSDNTRQWITEMTAKTLVLTVAISFLGQLALGLNTLLAFFGDVKGGWVKTFAGLGTVLTIGLAVSSIEDFIKGDIMKGIIDTTATVISAFGVAGLIKGKAGAGYLFAIAVGLHLIGAGTFFSTILGIAGVIFGVFSGLGEYIVAIVIWGVKNAWNDAQSALKATIGVSLPKFTDIGKMPDFTDIMGKDVKGWFGVGYSWGKELDTTMQSWINELEKNTNALNQNTDTTKKNTEQPNLPLSTTFPSSVAM